MQTFFKCPSMGDVEYMDKRENDPRKCQPGDIKIVTSCDETTAKGLRWKICEDIRKNQGHDMKGAKE